MRMLFPIFGHAQWIISKMITQNFIKPILRISCQNLLFCYQMLRTGFFDANFVFFPGESNRLI